MSMRVTPLPTRSVFHRSLLEELIPFCESHRISLAKNCVGRAKKGCGFVASGDVKDGLRDEFPELSALTNLIVTRHFASMGEITAAELVVGLDDDVVNGVSDIEMPEIRNQGVVERHQKGASRMVRGGRREIGGAKNGEGRLAASSRSQHDNMTLSRKVENVLLGVPWASVAASAR